MRSLVFCGLAAAWLLVAIVPAQEAPRRPASPPVMLATERYLFVIRDDVLWQFDVQSLALLHSFSFSAAARGGARSQRAEPNTAGLDRAVSVGVPEVTAPEVAAPEVVVEEVTDEPAAAAPAAATPEASVAAALRWLKKHQDEDGKWDADQFMKHDPGSDVCDGPGRAVHDVGVTGLAMLAMLGSGSTLRVGPYRDSLKRAAKWLKEQQQENGLFGTNTAHDFIYDHAIATFAMSEAFGLSNYQLLRSNVQKGVNYLEAHRNPFSVWRYQPRDNDNDTSVTTWAVCALTSARNFGLDINRDALEMAGQWYDQVTAPDGRVGYSKRGEPSSRLPGDHAQRFPVENVETMTAAATFARLMLGQDAPNKRTLRAAAAVVAKKPPKWEPGHVDAVYWYFGTGAMYQMGGEHWEAWRPALATLIAHQRQDGVAAGSWDPVGVWDEVGGRVFVTALYALALQTAHRAERVKK